MFQDNYTQTMPIGFPGMIADTCAVQDIETFYNPDGPVAFGRFVCRADEQTIKHPAAAGDVSDRKKARGVVVGTHEQVTQYPGGVATTPQYLPQLPIPVMRKGRIIVLVEDQVTEGTSDVYVRTGGTGLLGAFRASDDGTNAELLENARFKTSTSGPNQLAVLEIDL